MSFSQEPLHSQFSTMDDDQLHHPLLLPFVSPSTTTTATVSDGVTDPASSDESTLSSNFSIALRLLLIITVGFVSTWANYEASKGFAITVTNTMKNTPAGDKFSLFYVSNDEAIRLVQSSSDFAASILYPNGNSMQEKLIDQVDIQLASYNLSHDNIVITKPFDQKNKHILSISPIIMEFDDFRYRMRKEIQRGMAVILLRSDQNNAPESMLNGLVEYISNLAGFVPTKHVFMSRDSRGKCWEDTDPQIVAQFLSYCEGESKGFVGRLYQEMKENWDEKVVDRALGMPAKDLCESFHNHLMKNKHGSTSDSISSYR